MSHATLIAEVEDWLLAKALGDPDIRALFEKLCARLHAIGIPLARAALSWPTLHPLFQAEQVFWWPGEGAKLEQYYHSSAGSEAWIKSPFYHMLGLNLSHLRRRLVGDGALLDFEVLEDFRSQGFTDYLLTATPFGIAEVETFSNGRSGIMASFATKRDGGFTDDDLEALRRIQRFFAVACRASIQRRVTDNIASAYLGSTAGRRVLAGDIRRGDGERIPAVVWYSDMRGSTRLSSTMDPDSYLQLLNKYFECTAAQVIAHDGEILNFIGDGVLAIFPIHESCPAHASAQAEAAARAALAARERCVAERQAKGLEILEFGIALAVGDVMFGNIGVPDRLAFSGIGKVVNAVQRIESQTKAVGIPVLASPDFARAAPGDWTRAATVEMPDFGKQMDVFTLAELAATETATRTAAE